MGENLKPLFLRINFQQNTPTLKGRKVQGKIGYKLISRYCYSTDPPLQKHAFIFLTNKYFGKYGLFKATRMYFNVIVSKIKTLSDTLLDNRI